MRWKPGVNRPLTLTNLEKIQFEKSPRLKLTTIAQLPSPIEVVRLQAEELARLQNQAAFELAEPDCLYLSNEKAPLTADPRRGDLWGLDRINITDAWAMTEGRPSIIVSVNDSGVDFTHEDLAENMWRNPAEIAGNNIDDDGNGCVDDVTGCDHWYNNGNTLLGARNYPHGTHVAGTIAAVKGNGTGVVGVAPKVRIMDSISFPTGGGFGASLRSTMLKSVAYSVKMGAHIINASWATQTTMTTTEREALDFAYSQGVIVVVAAGNDGDPVVDQFPMSHPKVIAVAATGPWDELAHFSNFGANVHFSAPGGMGTDENGRPLNPVLSTVPVNQYGNMSGTSMAAPHVAGLVALMLSMNPTLSLEQVRAVLRRGADAIDVVPFYHPTMPQTLFRINAARTLAIVRNEFPYQDPNPIEPPPNSNVPPLLPPPACVGEQCKAEVGSVANGATAPRWVSGCSGRARDSAADASSMLMFLLPGALWVHAKRKRR